MRKAKKRKFFKLHPRSIMRLPTALKTRMEHKKNWRTVTYPNACSFYHFIPHHSLAF